MPPELALRVGGTAPAPGNWHLAGNSPCPIRFFSVTQREPDGGDAPKSGGHLFESLSQPRGAGGLGTTTRLTSGFGAEH